MFQSLCGKKVLGNVLLTTSQWSKVDQAEGEYRESRLRNQDFWGGLIDKGATLQRFLGTRESGLELIHKLMPNTRKPLDIQDQIVEQHMTLLETNAGKCINEELAVQEKKHKEELESLEKERQEAIKAKDHEMKEILAAEQEKAQKKLDNAAAERKLLSQRVAEMQKHEAEKKDEEAKRDRAVIAVATKDIAVTAHITALFKSYDTKGRRILDTNNHKEFESEPFPITINYRFNILFGIQACAKTLQELFEQGMGETNYIVLDGVQYRCKSGAPIRIGSQQFVLFSRG